MGLFVFIIGLVLWLATSLNLFGIILMIVGVILFFVPHTYGYSDWRGRRGPPP